MTFRMVFILATASQIAMKRPTDYPSPTPEEFRAALTSVGWSQADFAARAGLAKPTVSMWATGKTPIPPWAGAWLETLRDLDALHKKYLTPPKKQRQPNAKL